MGPDRATVFLLAPGTGRFSWLAPMALWPLARHLLPADAIRLQGGGTRRADEEAVFAAVLYVLVSGESWRALPKSFPVSWQNAHRRFGQWCEEGLWVRMAETARTAPQVPPSVREWADRIAETARSRRAEPPSPYPVNPYPVNPDV
ncbi:transposase [Streptomyces sp. CC208A]|uniref:transposase n=1 Tax=Streptomyces sp. CC208A TaxID=3044573 RepID=UPI0024A7BC36|nr:transposase [Streptomyces sp. CC208A]